MPRRPSAFTLIELLVVISIISVLISVLLPAIARANDLAKVAKCLANQKQIAMLGVGVYGSDNKGFLVPPAGISSLRAPSANHNVYNVTSPSTLGPSMATYNVEMWELLEPSTDLTKQPAEQKPAYAYCPATPKLWPGSNPSYPYFEANYAQNIYLSSFGGVSNPVIVGLLAENVRKPSDKLFFGEIHQLALSGVRNSWAQVYPGNFINILLFPQEMLIAGWTPASPQRHLQGFTASHVDGHASFVKPQPIYEPGWLVDAAGVTSSVWYNPWASAANYREIWDPAY